MGLLMFILWVLIIDAITGWFGILAIFEFVAALAFGKITKKEAFITLGVMIAISIIWFYVI